MCFEGRAFCPPHPGPGSWPSGFVRALGKRETFLGKREVAGLHPWIQLRSQWTPFPFRRIDTLANATMCISHSVALRPGCGIAQVRPQVNQGLPSAKVSSSVASYLPDVSPRLFFLQPNLDPASRTILLKQIPSSASLA